MGGCCLSSAVGSLERTQGRTLHVVYSCDASSSSEEYSMAWQNCNLGSCPSTTTYVASLTHAFDASCPVCSLTSDDQGRQRVQEASHQGHNRVSSSCHCSSSNSSSPCRIGLTGAFSRTEPAGCVSQRSATDGRGCSGSSSGSTCCSRQQQWLGWQQSYGAAGELLCGCAESAGTGTGQVVNRSVGMVESSAGSMAAHST